MNTPNINPVESDCGGKAMKHTCEHHEECMKIIQLILDGEATEVEKDHFRNNIDICLPCIKSLELEKCIKDSLCNKIEKRPCPEKLVALIKEKITSSEE